MSHEIMNIPQADILMGSMRSMGYSFEAAIADVVDNSISANASNIRILFPSSPLEDVAVGILDDGIGMSKDKLLEAMRYGCSSSETIRNENDLGRFGLGLKSASLSQCRVLTVVSILDGVATAFSWDYNHIQTKKQWFVLQHNKEEIFKLPYIKRLFEQGRGTLVLWRDFDILSKSTDGQVYDALNKYKDIVADYLSWIFHRYISRIQNRIDFYVNNHKLNALDPFLESHKKTTLKKEKYIAVTDSNGKEQQIKIKPFIMPYLSDMTEKDKKLMGGVEDMRSRQGFYIYRNERLIIWGKWFGMSRRNELTKNARIRVDIPNALDDIWGIDIKKQVAKIPKRIQNQLSRMVEDALSTSITKHTHRGRKEKVDENIDYIWDRIEGRNKNYFYQINRDSVFYKFILERINEDDVVYFNMLINEIERNIPIQQIYIDKSNDSISEKEDEHRSDEVYESAVTLIDNYVKIGNYTAGYFINKLMSSEPFCHYPQIHAKLKKHYADETE